LYHDYQNEADSMAGADGADGASPALKNGNVNAAGVG